MHAILPNVFLCFILPCHLLSVNYFRVFSSNLSNRFLLLIQKKKKKKVTVHGCTQARQLNSLQLFLLSDQEEEAVFHSPSRKSSFPHLWVCLSA